MAANMVKTEDFSKRVVHVPYEELEKDDQQRLLKAIFEGKITSYEDSLKLPQLKIPDHAKPFRLPFSRINGACIVSKEIANYLISTTGFNNLFGSSTPESGSEWSPANTFTNMRIFKYWGQQEMCYDHLKKMVLHLNAAMPEWLPPPRGYPPMLCEKFMYLSDAAENPAVWGEIPCGNIFKNKGMVNQHVISVCLDPRHKASFCGRINPVVLGEPVEVKSEELNEDSSGGGVKECPSKSLPSTPAEVDFISLRKDLKAELDFEYEEAHQKAKDKFAKEMRDLSERNQALMKLNLGLKAKYEDYNKRLKVVEAQMSDQEKLFKENQELLKATQELTCEKRKNAQELLQAKLDQEELDIKFKSLLENTTELALAGSNLASENRLRHLKSIKESAKALLEAVEKEHSAIKTDVENFSNKTEAVCQNLEAFAHTTASPPAHAPTSTVLVTEVQKDLSPQVEVIATCSKDTTSSKSPEKPKNDNPPIPVPGYKISIVEAKYKQLGTSTAQDNISCAKAKSTFQSAKGAKILSNPKSIKRKCDRSMTKQDEEAPEENSRGNKALKR